MTRDEMVEKLAATDWDMSLDPEDGTWASLDDDGRRSWLYSWAHVMQVIEAAGLRLHPATVVVFDGPTDADYDDMHHALGRPKSAVDVPYRNHYCADLGTPAQLRIEEMSKSLGWWCFTRFMNDQKMAVYSVTDAGRIALDKWLAAKQQERGDAE